MEPGTPHTWPPARAIDTFIRLVLLGGLLLWCVLILAPFTSILLWAVILAVALYPLFAALAHRLGGRTTWAAALIVVTGLTAVAVPGYFTGRSLVNSVNILRGHLSAEELHVPQLPADWYQGTGIRRIIADRWPSKDSAVAELIESHSAEIQAGAKHTLQALSGFTMGLLMLILSILVAGVLLANAKAGSSAAERFLDRVMGRNGAAMVDLAASTVRQVAKGILGVAVLQAAMFALGVFVAGVPAAGLLTIVALMLCVVQIGAAPIAIGVIIYAWASMGNTPAVLLTFWMVVTMVSDNILKPMLLGRGAQVPTAVIFLGAIGGFLLSGFIGLFTGAVVLSIGYRLMQGWMTGEVEIAEKDRPTTAG